MLVHKLNGLKNADENATVQLDELTSDSLNADDSSSSSAGHNSALIDKINR